MDLDSLLLLPRKAIMPNLPVVTLPALRAIQVFTSRINHSFFLEQYEILSLGQPEVFEIFDRLIDSLPSTEVGQKTLACLLLQALECTLQHCDNAQHYHHLPRLKYEGLGSFCGFLPPAHASVLDPMTIDLMEALKLYNPYLWQAVKNWLVQFPASHMWRIRLIVTLYLLVDRAQTKRARRQIIAGVRRR